jgi:hypothetical protein
MRAQGGDQIRVLRASSQRVAHEDVVDQFLASPIDAAEALGFGDAWGQIHTRCRSPWSGWLRPPVPISDPVGLLRIWVVAASTSSLRSPSTITDVWLSSSSLFRGPWRWRGR